MLSSQAPAGIFRVTLLGCLAATILATPFGTINGLLGQHNEHEMITRIAFQCPPGQKSDGICFEPRSLNQLAGTHGSVPLTGTNGAVGAPDLTDPFPEGAEAHCDDADFLAIPGYKRTRAQATEQLQKCVNHLRRRYEQGWKAAERLLNDKNEIEFFMVDLSSKNGGDCTFAFESLQVNLLGRAKCNAIEGFGRSLHGVEDFYSHSNWADHEDSSRPISDVNPPGLGLTSDAPFLDLRASNDISSQVPPLLSTGCFVLNDKAPSPAGTLCQNRVTHAALNKDHGIIKLDGSIGAAGPDTPRSDIKDNFALAVRSAIRDARRQWDLFRDEIKRQYGPEQGNLMICALVRDDPVKDCKGRRIAIVVDSSSSNLDTDPANLRVQAAIDFNSKLTTKADAGPDGAPDNVTVIDFDDSARVIYPMGDPASASFAGIDSSGGTDIGSGIELAISQIVSGQQGDIAHRSGIVVLTDGEDNNPANQIAQLARASSLGIRVNFGFLSPPAIPVPRSRRSLPLRRRSAAADLQLAVLRTGGLLGTIDSAEAQQSFIDSVLARGATDLDAPALGNSLPLTPGVSITDFLASPLDAHRFTYAARAGEKLDFTVTAETPGAGVRAVLHDVRRNADVGSASASGAGGPAVIHFDSAGPVDLELVVAGAGAGNATNRTAEVLFTVSVGAEVPGGNGTANSTSTVCATSAPFPTAGVTAPYGNVTVSSTGLGGDVSYAPTCTATAGVIGCGNGVTTDARPTAPVAPTSRQPVAPEATGAGAQFGSSVSFIAVGMVVLSAVF